jgi:RimJ/RimL family protein N-acetyltransferase
MSGADLVRLRPAEPADAERLLAWRNDPATRAASLTRDVIDLQTHRAWLERRLADPDCALFIIEHEDRPVGQVRAERSAAAAEVSIGLAADARGRGIGARSLQALEPEVARWPVVVELVAHVRTENAASLRLFAAAGYVETSRHDGVARLAKRV